MSFLQGLANRLGIPLGQLINTPLVQAALTKPNTLAILNAAEAAFARGGIGLLDGYNSISLASVVARTTNPGDAVAIFERLDPARLQFMVLRLDRSNLAGSLLSALESAKFGRYGSITFGEYLVYKGTGIRFQSFDNQSIPQLNFDLFLEDFGNQIPGR
ncbi:hypothetical protein [Laspinema olomoucense]|uniref:hypothetical protein n=1 Tax=Laspinema olomoucense TaxID=3231600 RepID=UPI0021BA7854|nr:hypothetical protein [Laspinema sp. D3c]MCT7994448.1 hypothetical protein [Laspinema sp. D3c]